MRLTLDQALLRTAVFFALLLACTAALQALVSHGLRRIDTSSFGVWNRILAGQVGADIVISGSSRALNHYDPRRLTEATGLSAFNIGLNGSQTDMQLARLRAYLRHNRAPRLLIHNLDLFSLQVSPGEVFDPAQYGPYLDERTLYEALARIDEDAWKWRMLPLYTYAVEDMRFTWIKGLAALAGWRPAEDHAEGYLPQHRSWTGEFIRWREDHPHGVLVPVQREGERALEELLALCRRKGIAVLLVYSPEYHEVQPLTLNRRAVFERFARLASRHGATLWDWSESPISRDPRHFYNSQHLNAQGADLFSRELAARLHHSDLPGARSD